MSAGLHLFKESVCACRDCVSMCEHRPCWPTPGEARAIKAAGLGGRLMHDYWAADKDHPDDVAIDAPAVVGYEGKRAPFIPIGRCTFLTKENKCELHALGLKPLEGRVNNHATSSKRSKQVRLYLVGLWEKEQQ